MERIKLLYDLFKLNSFKFYNEELLVLDFAVWVFFLTGFFSVLMVIIYYYVIDRPRTSKLSVWLIFLLLNSIILSILAYVIANNTIINAHLSIGDQVPDYFIDLIYFAVMNFIFAATFFLIFSSLLKWKSRNSSHVPF